MKFNLTHLGKVYEGTDRKVWKWISVGVDGLRWMDADGEIRYTNENGIGKNGPNGFRMISSVRDDGWRIEKGPVD